MRRLRSSAASQSLQCESGQMPILAPSRVGLTNQPDGEAGGSTRKRPPRAPEPAGRAPAAPLRSGTCPGRARTAHRRRPGSRSRRAAPAPAPRRRGNRRCHPSASRPASAPDCLSPSHRPLGRVRPAGTRGRVHCIPPRSWKIPAPDLSIEPGRRISRTPPVHRSRRAPGGCGRPPPAHGQAAGPVSGSSTSERHRRIEPAVDRQLDEEGLPRLRIGRTRRLVHPLPVDTPHAYHRLQNCGVYNYGE